MILYNTHYRDRFCTGMSLLELMVVIVILGLLAVSIIPAIDANDERKAREAAITVSSLVASANSRARQTSDGAGIWLEPLDKSTTPSRGSADLFVAQPGYSYTGEDSAAQSHVFLNPIPNSNPKQAVAVFSLQKCPNLELYCDLYSQIYIEGRLYSLTLPAPAPYDKPEFLKDFLPPPYNVPLPPDHPDDNPIPVEKKYPISTGLITTISPDTAAIPTSSPAYNADDTSRSIPALDSGHPTFSILTSPTRSSTAPLSLPNGYVVDIAWSSYGTILFREPNQLQDQSGIFFVGIYNFLPNQPVLIMFNSIGEIQEVRYRYSDAAGEHNGRLQRNADVFLLIGRADRAGNPYAENPSENNPGANWQYPDSRWIKISQTNGTALISDIKLGVNNLYQSQDFVRRSLGASRN